MDHSKRCDTQGVGLKKTQFLNKFDSSSPDNLLWKLNVTPGGGGGERGVEIRSQMIAKKCHVLLECPLTSGMFQ
jgi:hypothetical protein